MCQNFVWIGWNRRYVNFQGGRRPLLGGLHVTCDAHFRTWPSYSSQKSCVKIWFRLVEPFKGNCGNIPPTPQKKLNFPRQQKPLMRVACIWPVMPIFELGWAIPVTSHVWKFGLDWLKSEICEFSRGGGAEVPCCGGGEVTCDLWCPLSSLAELFQSKVMCGKFGSDWLSLSRVIVVTSKNKWINK